MRRIALAILLLALVNGAWRFACGDDKAKPKAKRPVVKKPAPSKVQPASLEFATNSLGMKLVKIPAGTFNMGSDLGFDDEAPVHRVTISKPFFLAVTEVTQGQYEALMAENPSQNVGSSDHPVDSVSWLRAVEFCERLSEKEGLQYRLPTEAEWEYACRAGSQGKIGLGEGGVEVPEDEIEEYAWLRLNSDGTQPVGQKKPNAWGLHDMHGNVFEWCQDHWLPYSEKPATDPVLIAKKIQRAAGGETFVLRGGSCEWGLDNSTAAARCRCNKNLRSRTVGFRVARSI
jgi:formylglycine-generating enzyme required for sulfatase activity